MNFKEKLANETATAETIIKAFLPRQMGECEKLHEAMNYSVLAGGKRLRPILMRAAFRLCGGDSDLEESCLKPFMAAIEMIHTYSLVHDDLPAMDNDLLRRGKPTTHAAYGEAMAILTGDALLNLAFETMSSCCDRVDEDAAVLKRILKAQYLIGRNSGVYGMIGGQVLDIKNEQLGRGDLELVSQMYNMKTGCLIEASLMAGAVLAGAGDKVVFNLKEAGEKLGLAFQIKDDILDETSTEEELGKPIHSDIESGKMTYAQIVGLERAQELVFRFSNEAKELLLKTADLTQGDAGFLTKLFDYLIDRKN